MLWVDCEHPANQGVLQSLRRWKWGRKLIAPPSSVGTHPDVLERLWDELGARVPPKCRCLVYGVPALVHDLSGVALAVANGTYYRLRVPRGTAAAARRTGARPIVYKGFGKGWIWGHFLSAEADWLRAVYEEFNPCNPPRRLKIDRAWLAWNNGTVPALARGMYGKSRLHEMPILADALEDAGCTDTEILTHCRKQGPHQEDCWVLALLLGKLN